jgi:hypothetical protein
MTRVGTAPDHEGRSTAAAKPLIMAVPLGPRHIARVPPHGAGHSKQRPVESRNCASSTAGAHRRGSLRRGAPRLQSSERARARRRSSGREERTLVVVCPPDRRGASSSSAASLTCSRSSTRASKRPPRCSRPTDPRLPARTAQFQPPFAVAAVGQHHGQLSHDAAGMMTATPLAHRQKRPRQRVAEPEPIGRLGQRSGASVRASPSPSDATSTVKRRPSRIAIARSGSAMTLARPSRTRLVLRRRLCICLVAVAQPT